MTRNALYGIALIVAVLFVRSIFTETMTWSQSLGNRNAVAVRR